MVREPLDLLGQSTGVEPLDGLDDPRMQGAPAVGEQASIRHLVGQRMLEGVLDIAARGLFIDELR